MQLLQEQLGERLNRLGKGERLDDREKDRNEKRDRGNEASEETAVLDAEKEKHEAGSSDRGGRS